MKSFYENYPVKICLFYRELIFDDDWNEWIELFICDKRRHWNLFQRPQSNYLSVGDGLKKGLIFKNFSRVLNSSLKYRVYNWHCVKVMILLRLYVSPDVVFISETVFITEYHYGHLGLLLWPPNALSHLSPELLVILSPHFSSVHIRRGLVVGIWKLINNCWAWMLHRHVLSQPMSKFELK